MAEASVTALTADEKGKRMDQAIDALKFAHDTVYGAMDDATAAEHQSAIMDCIVALGIERAALSAAQGQIAHG